MKPRFSNQRNHALTLVEVLVVIVVLAVLAIVFLPAIQDNNANNRARRIVCVNNLKEISLAYRIWAGDHNDKFPFQVPITNGGTMDLAVTGDVVTTFQIMSNELSTPKLLICPTDNKRVWATNLTTGFSDKNVSYFVGLDASKKFPQALLSGDDNFEIGGVSVKSGLLELSTNAPISWTYARHKFVGNIGFADGSVLESYSQIDSLTNLLQKTGVATNRLAIP